MAASTTLRADLIGDSSSLSRAFRQAADNAELAARGARHAAEALELQRKTASTSARASESLAKSDEILAEVEGRLRDGALEAEFALKRETEAKKAAARASLEQAAADRKAASEQSGLAKFSKGLTGGFSGSLLGALPAAIPVIGAAIGPVAAVTAGLGGAAVAAGAFGLLAKTAFSQVSTAASAYAKAQDKLSALEASGTSTSKQRAAALAAEKAALNGLNPAQKTMVTNLISIKGQWGKLSASVATPVLASWLSAANDGLKFMRPLVAPIATVFQAWGQVIDRYFKSGNGSREMTKIATALGNFGASQMRDIGVFLFDVGSAVKHLGSDLAGHNVDFGTFGDHLVTWGNAFRAWSSSAAARKDVGAFLGWVRSNGRTVADLLGSVAKIMPGLFSGLSGAGTLELKAITGFFGLVAHLPPWAQKWIGEGLPLFLVGSKALPAIGAMTGLIGKASDLMKLPAPAWLGGAGKTAAAGEGVAAGEAGAAGTTGAAGATAAGKTLGGLIGKGLLAGLVAALDVGLNKVIDHELGKGSSAGQFAKAGGEVLSGAIIGGMLAGPYGAAAGAIVGLIVGVFTNPKVRHDISGAFDLVRHDIAHVWDLTVRDTRIAWNDLYGATIGVAIRIGHNIETQWDSIRHGTASAFDHIRHDTASAMNDLYGATIGVAIRIGHNVETQWDSLRHSTANIFDGLRHDTAAAWDRIWADASGKVSHGIAVTVAWFRRLPGEAVSVLGNAGRLLLGWGEGVIGGLLNGMNSVIGKVWNFIKSIPGKILGFLGIHSPPQWAIDAGGHIMNGLGIGMSNAQAKLASAVKSAAAAAAAVPTAATAGSSGGVIATMMRNMAAARGWTGAQWNALYDVEMAEAGFSLTARNPSSGAYGLAQFINGPSEYYQYGGNPTTATGQITAMLNYIASRYGTPAAAWAHESAFHWYAGGTPSAAPGWAVVGERGPEIVKFRGGEQVIPARQVVHAGAGGGEVHVHLHNEGVIGSQAEMDRWVENSFNRLARGSRLRWALTQSPSAR